jgi:hypothetical protein
MVICSVSASSFRLRSSSGVPQARVAETLVVRVIWPSMSSRSKPPPTLVVAARGGRPVEIGARGLVLLFVQHAALVALAEHVQVVVGGLGARAGIGRETDAERHVLALVLGHAHQHRQRGRAGRRRRLGARALVQLVHLLGHHAGHVGADLDGGEIAGFLQAALQALQRGVAVLSPGRIWFRLVMTWPGSAAGLRSSGCRSAHPGRCR